MNDESTGKHMNARGLLNSGLIAIPLYIYIKTKQSFKGDTLWTYKSLLSYRIESFNGRNRA